MSISLCRKKLQNKKIYWFPEVAKKREGGKIEHKNLVVMKLSYYFTEFVVVLLLLGLYPVLFVSKFRLHQYNSHNTLFSWFCCCGKTNFKVFFLLCGSLKQRPQRKKEKEMLTIGQIKCGGWL